MRLCPESLLFCEPIFIWKDRCNYSACLIVFDMNDKPSLPGLFHGAILQSGNELLPWGILTPETDPEKYLVEVAEGLGCPTSNSQEMVACLQAIDADVLSQARFNCTVMICLYLSFVIFQTLICLL